MKKVIVFVIVVVSLSFLVGCGGDTTAEQKPTVTTLPIQEATPLSEYEKKENLRKENEAVSKTQEIPVGEDNFKKLVTFIEKNGFVVPQNGIPCDHQFTFFDSKGNRHAMITIKRDTAGNPSMKGNVSQISVWGYVKGIKDQNHFFGYGITQEKVFPFLLELDGTWDGVKEVTLGYKEFLAKVSK